MQSPLAAHVIVVLLGYALLALALWQVFGVKGLWALLGFLGLLLILNDK